MPPFTRSGDSVFLRLPRSLSLCVIHRPSMLNLRDPQKRRPRLTQALPSFIPCWPFKGGWSGALLTLLMCSYNAIQSGTLNTKRERCVPFHLYSPISPPFSRTHSLRVSLLQSVPLPLLPRNLPVPPRAADAAKERCVVQGAPAAVTHVAWLARPPAAPASPRSLPRPGQQTLQMGQKDLTERPR